MPEVLVGSPKQKRCMMNFDYAKDSKERLPYEHYLNLYQQAEPEAISERTGIPFDSDTSSFTLRLLGTTYHITHPEYQVTHEEDAVGSYPLEHKANARILVLRYLVEGHAAPTTGKFLTYREVPWGELYFRQFQGRCLSRLAFGFGNRLEVFRKCMEKIGGKSLTYGDASYEFELLNNLNMRLILWEGDEEFPPSSQILFADNFPVAFHGEDMAVAGDIINDMLKALSLM